MSREGESAAKLSCAALAVLKRFQLDPQVSGLLVTQLDGYKCQLALNSGRQNHSASRPESLASIFSITGNTLGSVLWILTVMTSLDHQLRVIIHDLRRTSPSCPIRSKPKDK